MITIAIPVYNRADILEKMATSLYDSNISDYDYNVRIYDDCSEEFGLEKISELFPDAKSIIRHKKNIGADHNMFYMYNDFLNYDDEYFFNADSDIIFSKNWLEDALYLIPKTDGVLSLFNTKTHLVSSSVDKDLCLKKYYGAAGVLFRKDKIKEICSYFGYSDIKGFDWQWCRYLRRNNTKLYCVNNSLVQHIGLIGQNSRLCNYDYGCGFVVDSVVNGKILAELFELYMNLSTKECQNRCREYTIGKKCCYIIDGIKKFIKEVIFFEKWG